MLRYPQIQCSAFSDIDTTCLELIFRSHSFVFRVEIDRARAAFIISIVLISARLVWLVFLFFLNVSYFQPYKDYLKF